MVRSLLDDSTNAIHRIRPYKKKTFARYNGLRTAILCRYKILYCTTIPITTTEHARGLLSFPKAKAIMADTPEAAAPAPVAAAEGEEVAEKKEEEAPKDTRSFEERLAELKKPDPVPQPDQDGVNEKLKGLNAKIEKCDKRLEVGFVGWRWFFLPLLPWGFVVAEEHVRERFGKRAEVLT
eukprot:693560-Rhodomonas_salina.1